jgi:hypothetical protein
VPSDEIGCECRLERIPERLWVEIFTDPCIDCTRDLKDSIRRSVLKGTLLSNNNGCMDMLDGSGVGRWSSEDLVMSMF